MTKTELIKAAFELLISEESHLSAAGNARLKQLLTEVIEDDDPEQGQKQTDARWHEYAVAALRAAGTWNGIKTAEHAVQAATDIADGMLKAAVERER